VPVDHPLVAVQLGAGGEACGIGAGRLRLGHGEAAPDLALEQRPQPLLLLLLGAVLGEDLHVARVGRRAVVDHRGDEAPPHLLAEHPVLPVGQAGAVALVGHEQVPQPLRLGPLAQLHEALGIGATGLDGHLLVERPEQLHFDRIDMLLVELLYAFEEALDLRRGSEVHVAAVSQGIAHGVPAG
jgi:hypothetical protein